MSAIPDGWSAILHGICKVKTDPEETAGCRWLFDRRRHLLLKTPSVRTSSSETGAKPVKIVLYFSNHDRENQNRQKSMKYSYIPPVLIFIIACTIFIEQQRAWQRQPASKRFIQQNIPLNEIFREWDQKGLRGPHYICSCTQTRCNSDQSWPYRSFQKGESVPVLGATNKSYAIDRGFTTCSTARTGE